MPQYLLNFLRSPCPLPNQLPNPHLYIFIKSPKPCWCLTAGLWEISIISNLLIYKKNNLGISNHIWLYLHFSYVLRWNTSIHNFERCTWRSSIHINLQLSQWRAGMKRQNLWHKTTNPSNIPRYNNKPPEFIGREFRVTLPGHSLEPKINSYIPKLNIVHARGKKKQKHKHDDRQITELLSHWYVYAMKGWRISIKRK